LSVSWLRGNHGGWVHSPQGAGVYNLSVSDLMIYPSEHKWDDAKIELMFSDEAARAIVETTLFDPGGSHYVDG